MEESDKPPEEKPTPNQQAVEDLSWDIPFARTIGNFFIREGKAVKNGWLAVAIIAGITFWLTHSLTEVNIDTEISGVTNYFNGEISNLRGQLTDAKQDRDKYQVMLAPFEAMAIAKYTNAPLDQRLDLLANQMGTIQTNTDSLSKEVAIVASRFPSPHPLLSEDEIQSITNDLTKCAKKFVPIRIVIADSDKSAFDLGNQLADLFIQSGFTNVFQGPGPINAIPQYGIKITLPGNPELLEPYLIGGANNLAKQLKISDVMIIVSVPYVLIVIGKY
jgi:hypothetical protein